MEREELDEEAANKACYMIQRFCQRIAISMFIDSRTFSNYQRKVLMKEHFYRK